MRRREFIAFLGAAAASPLAANAQPSISKLPTVGFLGTSSATVWSTWTAAFVQRLHQLGWIEGQTVAIEYRWANSHEERYTELAAELVRRQPNVIVTSGPAVHAVEQASSAIPIVFAIAVDPLGMGLVKSLARPEGNVTGSSLQTAEIAGKRVSLLRDVIPSLRVLAILANVGYSGALDEMRQAQAAARTLDIDVITLEIRKPEEIVPAINTLSARAGALYVATDPLISANRMPINASALVARLPTVSGFREFAVAGGLMCYGANFPDLFRRAADMVDKILHGMKPADIPVEQPTKFDLIVNRKTATALGLEIPPMLLATADEVIE